MKVVAHQDKGVNFNFVGVIDKMEIVTENVPDHGHWDGEPLSIYTAAGNVIGIFGCAVQFLSRHGNQTGKT